MSRNSKIVRIDDQIARELEQIRKQAMREFGQYWSTSKCLEEWRNNR